MAEVRTRFIVMLFVAAALTFALSIAETCARADEFPAKVSSADLYNLKNLLADKQRIEREGAQVVGMIDELKKRYGIGDKDSVNTDGTIARAPRPPEDKAAKPEKKAVKK